jgi:hypothetical protein
VPGPLDDAQFRSTFSTREKISRVAHGYFEVVGAMANEQSPRWYERYRTQGVDGEYVVAKRLGSKQVDFVANDAGDLDGAMKFISAGTPIIEVCGSSEGRNAAYAFVTRGEGEGERTTKSKSGEGDSTIVFIDPIEDDAKISQPLTRREGTSTATHARERPGRHNPSRLVRQMLREFGEKSGRLSPHP